MWLVFWIWRIHCWFIYYCIKYATTRNNHSKNSRFPLYNAIPEIFTLLHTRIMQMLGLKCMLLFIDVFWRKTFFLAFEVDSDLQEWYENSIISTLAFAIICIHHLLKGDTCTNLHGVLKKTYSYDHFLISTFYLVYSFTEEITQSFMLLEIQ